MFSYPLARQGQIIGAPYSGTHTLGNWQSDNAVDIGIPMGTPVLACADGEIGPLVGSLGRGGRFAGLRLYVDTPSNSYYYAHLSYIGVRPGQPVQVGQVIGRSGTAGVPHLHFAARDGSPWVIVRSSIYREPVWTRKRRFLWLRWWLGEGEFRRYGPRNMAHRPRSLPRKVPRFVWAFARRFLRRRR